MPLLIALWLMSCIGIGVRTYSNPKDIKGIAIAFGLCAVPLTWAFGNGPAAIIILVSFLVCILFGAWLRRYYGKEINQFLRSLEEKFYELK